MGALTNKPMAFNSRNWEYQSQLIHDITDFLTPRIRVDQFNGKVYRILPTVEWISNRIRFLYLGLRNQRINAPMATYLIVMKLELFDRIIFLEKKVLSLISYENSFILLKNRLLLEKRKAVNVIYGSLFDADPTVFNVFETAKTKIYHQYELNFSKKVEINKMIDVTQQFQNGKSSSLVFFGVNPRIESPLLNLKIKELEIDKVYSIGNLSYSFPVVVLGNNSILSLYIKKGYIQIVDAIMVFGQSTLSFVDQFNEFKKIILIPIYMFNNYIRYNSNSLEKNKERNKEDVNIYLSTQNLLAKEIGFNFVLSTHFETLNRELNNSITIPISGYLESNFKFFDKDLSLIKINSLKPNFNINDFLSAFKLFIHARNFTNKIGNNIFIPKKKKINNILINDSVPNYLIRDPLGRANPLFNSIVTR